MDNRLKNGEILEILRGKLDDFATTPYFDDEQLAAFFNEAFAEWVKQTYAATPEMAEKFQYDFGWLIRKEALQSQFKQELPEAMVGGWILALFGTYQFDRQGTTVDLERPIKPVTWDSYATIKDDPDNCPNDYWPLYVRFSEDNQLQLQILSDNQPSNLSAVYMKTPELLSAKAEDKDKVIEIGRPQQYEVIARTIRIAQLIVEDQPGYQAQLQGEIPLKS